MPKLSIQDHSRDSAGMTYVYPVVSRRAGGVSIGINLNPNNACNWRCIYCQVPDLKRGGPPPIELARLESELCEMLSWLYRGDYLARHAPPEAQRVVDIAFSGNGEPTMAAEFTEAVMLVGQLVDDFLLTDPPRMRLITNGSQLGKAAVQSGIAAIGRRGGEVWFKLDAVGPAAMRRVNGAALSASTVLRRMKSCAGLCTTWAQTCLFALDGDPPSDEDQAAYLSLLAGTGRLLAGVHLYGLARPSLQPEATRLAPLPLAWLEGFARRIESEVGLPVRLSP